MCSVQLHLTGAGLAAAAALPIGVEGDSDGSATAGALAAVVGVAPVHCDCKRTTMPLRL